jgi:hypothetical protein
MSFFTTRERAELGKSAEIKTERKVRDVVRNEFAPRRRPDSEPPGYVGSVRQQRPADNDLEGHIGSVMQKVTKSSLQEIDDVIVALRRRREELIRESAHVQRAVIEYAKLSQSTMQSARIITESLSHLNRIPAPPQERERMSRRRRFQRAAPRRQRKFSSRAIQYARSSRRNRSPG